MSRRLWAGAIVAPTAVVVGATAAFLFTGDTLSVVPSRIAESLTQASARVNQLRADLNGPTRNDAMPPAPRIDVARAPDADRAAPPEEPRASARVLSANSPLAALSVEPAPQEIAAAPESKAPRAPAAKTDEPSDSKKLVVASLPPTPAPKIKPSSVEPVPVIEVVREEILAPMATAEVIRAEIPAPVQPVPVIEVVREEILAPIVTAEVIRAEIPAPAAVVREEKPAPASAPAPEVTIAREDNPEPKTIFAALSLAGTAMAATAPPTTVAVASERPAPVEKKPEPVQVASLDFTTVDRQLPRAAAPVATEVTPAEQPEPSADQAETEPGQMNMHFSAPLRMRALTRADLLPQEKLASLGALKGDSLPAEQQRVAYDEPAFTEVPVSVGKRKWIDETKYKGLGSPEALLEALKHLGANAKSMGLPASLWCADFMNLVLRKSGVPATGSRAARSYLQYGQKIDEPRVGAIAIFSRGRNSGHVGIVRGTDGKGNPIIVSGNHGNKVAEATYPKARVIAYVVPK
jgi:uncharacterized protein (TIGR02594 family)